RPIVWDATPKERFGLPDIGPATGQAESFAAETPADWRQEPADPANFKDLIWSVPGDPGAQCWLTGGVRGGLAGNMVRWYRQFGLQPEMPESLPEIPFFDGRGRLLELTGTYNGTEGQAMLLAFSNRGDLVTSLKLVGPEAVVLSNKNAFLALAGSLRRGAGGGPSGGMASPGAVAPGTPNPHAADPQAGNPHAGNPGGADGLATGPFTADVPAAWQPKAGSPRSLHHAFGAAGDGEVYVSQLSGDIRPMLGVWRAELGDTTPLGDAEFAALPKCEMLGPDALWLDMTGNYDNPMSGRKIPNARSIVAVRNDGGTITFAKLIGPATDVMAEVEAFRTFCASLRRSQ
ncbi:MAG: hypothetical protein KDE27_24385, partial [Planctomycetes bacterium]|nr:hypothetical protein [Planctomycetota bacterium]